MVCAWLELPSCWDFRNCPDASKTRSQEQVCGLNFDRDGLVTVSPITTRDQPRLMRFRLNFSKRFIKNFGAIDVLDRLSLPVRSLSKWIHDHWDTRRVHDVV